MNNDKIITKLKEFKKTIKETSADKHDKNTAYYMTESYMMVIDFDAVKEDYSTKLNLKYLPKSNDALYIPKDSDKDWYFIEFKNGEIDQKRNFDIKLKIYDSLLILMDIIGETITFSQKHINYILVFNNEKNHSTKFFDRNILNSNEINSSSSRNYLVSRTSELANDTYIQFDLERFEKLYFKKVYTYTEGQFERSFISKLGELPITR